MTSPLMPDLDRHRMTCDFVGLQVTDKIQSTDARLIVSKAKSAIDIQRLLYNVIGYSQDMQSRNRELGDFLFTNLYRHDRVVRMQVKAEHIISDLYKTYISELLILPDHVQ
jgi:dGTPase